MGVDEVTVVASLTKLPSWRRLRVEKAYPGGGGARGKEKGRLGLGPEVCGAGFMEGKGGRGGGCRWRPQPRRHVRALLSLRTGEEESDRS